MSLSKRTPPETYLDLFQPEHPFDGVGLFISALCFGIQRSERWRVQPAILTEQLSRHVKSDGVYFEQSSYYHRYTTDFYLHLWILRINGEQAPSGLKEKLALLLDHLMYITRRMARRAVRRRRWRSTGKARHRPANDFRVPWRQALRFSRAPTISLSPGRRRKKLCG